MIMVMNSLEARFFNKNDIISMEMGECLEILFVEHGYYKVGYEVNKKTFFRRQFGESTTIGGFEICYQKKFIFKYIASSFMKC